jgi:5-keto-L-gluconate epimerase
MPHDTPTKSKCLPGPWKLTGALSPAAGPFAPILFAGRLEEGIDALGEMGYDAVEISLRRPSEIDPAWLEGVLAKHDLTVSAIASGRMFYEGGLSISSPERETRRAAVEQLKEHVGFAARLGSALVVGGVRGTLPRDATADTLRKHAQEALREVAEEASARGVQLLLEPINRYETNFLNTAEEALAFIEEGGLEGVKLLLDTFHMNIEEVSIEGAIRLAGPRLGYVHLVDSNRRAPGCGHTDFGPVLDALLKCGYTAYLGMEVLPWPDDPGAARLGVENTRKLVSEVVDRFAQVQGPGSRVQSGLS